MHLKTFIDKSCPSGTLYSNISNGIMKKLKFCFHKWNWFIVLRKYKYKSFFFSGNAHIFLYIKYLILFCLTEMMLYKAFFFSFLDFYFQVFRCYKLFIFDQLFKRFLLTIDFVHYYCGKMLKKNMLTIKQWKMGFK